MLTRRTILHAIALTAVTPLAARAAEDTAYDFTFTDIDGGPLPLSQFRGRPLMVVNTASLCGYTYQYDGLQALSDRYGDRGLAVLTVPSDDFAGQELDTEAEVKEFCKINFNLDLPMTNITRVKGPQAHPFYKWALARLGPGNAPKWNFHKYLVDGGGQLVQAFPTRTDPMAPEVRTAIEDLLNFGPSG